MLKRNIIAILIVVILAAGGIVLWRLFSGNNAASAGLEETNLKIQALEKEKQNLNRQLSGRQVMLCFAGFSDRAVHEIGDLLEEKPISATMVFENGQMPGDGFCLSPEGFTEALHYGWEYGIGCSRVQFENSETWQAAVSNTINAFQPMTEYSPESYYDDSGALNTEEIAFLKKLGIKNLLSTAPYDQNNGDVKVIRLYGYATPGLVPTLVESEGYYGLLIKDLSSTETDEYAYSSEEFAALTDNERLKIVPAKKLQPLTSVAGAASGLQVYDSTEAIQNRLAEIDAALKELYQ